MVQAPVERSGIGRRAYESQSTVSARARRAYGARRSLVVRSIAVFRLTSRVEPEFLWAMLYEAVFWRDTGEEERPGLDQLRSEPWFARYVEGWGRDGDAALVALDRNDEGVGAAWYRTFSAEDAGFGFVSPDVPELSIGVYGEFRGRGVGSLLLGSLIVRARAHDVRALSLSVAAENPARRLYERHGFTDVRFDDGGSYVMRLDLR